MAADRRSSRRDGGFTLTEVLIVVVIMGVLSTAIAAAFSVVVRTLPSTEARADDARSLLGLSSWLPSDVNSTPRIPESEVDTDDASFDRRSGSVGCGVSEGVNLLRLRSSETYLSTQRFDVSYRLVPRGTTWNIIRVSCVEGGSVAVNNLTAGLPAPAESPIDVSYRVESGTVVGVVMLVTTSAGDSLRIDTTSQNPDASLPPLGSVAIDPTTTVEITTTTESTTTTTVAPDPSDPTTTVEVTTPPESTAPPTTPPPPPCSASFVSAQPPSVFNTNNASSNNTNNVEVGSLLEPVRITVSKGPNCGNLGLEYEHLPPSTGWRAFGASSEVLIERSNQEQWSDGARTLRLRDGQSGTVLATLTLTVN